MTEFVVRAWKIGNVIEFDWRFMRALIKLDVSMRVGDLVHIVGPDTDFRQRVKAMEHMREKVKRGKASQKVWIPMEARARPGDAVELLERGEDQTQPLPGLKQA